MIEIRNSIAIQMDIRIGQEQWTWITLTQSVFKVRHKTFIVSCLQIQNYRLICLKKVQWTSGSYDKKQLIYYLNIREILITYAIKQRVHTAVLLSLGLLLLLLDTLVNAVKILPFTMKVAAIQSLLIINKQLPQCDD